MGLVTELKQTHNIFGWMNLLKIFSQLMNAIICNAIYGRRHMKVLGMQIGEILWTGLHKVFGAVYANW